MATTSAIEWTDATWNPVVGCVKVSPGCAHCYAETLGKRLRAMALADLAAGRNPGRKRHYIDAVDEMGRWSGKLITVPEALPDPLGWRQPKMVFVNSMSALFHKSVPFEFVDKVFAVMALSYWHTFQVLTKRPDRMAKYFADEQTRIRSIWDAMGRSPHFSSKDRFPMIRPALSEMAHQVRGYDVHWPWSKGRCGYFTNPPWPLCNVWLGTSVEDQKRADERIPHLLRCPASATFAPAASAGG